MTARSCAPATGITVWLGRPGYAQGYAGQAAPGPLVAILSAEALAKEGGVRRQWNRPNSNCDTDFSLEFIIKLGNGVPRVIENFTCKETTRIFHGEYSRKFPGDIQPRALVKLHQLHRIIAIDQLRQPPSNRLESLSGNLKGFWSIRINQQWRILFRWKDGNATDVEITDYH